MFDKIRTISHKHAKRLRKNGSRVGFKYFFSKRKKYPTFANRDISQFSTVNSHYTALHGFSRRTANAASITRGFSVTPFPRIHRSRRSVRRIMVSFSICTSPTNVPISLVPPRFNNITHCCERGMHACKFATVFHQFRGCEPDALLPPSLPQFRREILRCFDYRHKFLFFFSFPVRRRFARTAPFANSESRTRRFSSEF